MISELVFGILMKCAFVCISVHGILCISVHGILCLYQCAWYPFLHRIPEHVISTRVVIIHVRLSSVIAWMYVI